MYSSGPEGATESQVSASRREGPRYASRRILDIGAWPPTWTGSAGGSMRVVEVSLRRFRGFENLSFQCADHVVLVGEPRAGRSVQIEGLRRALTSDGVRNTVPSELDFWMLDTSQRAEVEVVLGDLGDDLEQDFVDHIEAWDPVLGALAEPCAPTDSSDTGDTEWVLRLCYRAAWDDEQELATHWVDFPDESDPASDTFARVPRRLQDALPVVVVESRGRPLRLGPRSDFRRILDDADGGTLATAFEDLVAAVAEAGAALATSSDIESSVNKVLHPVEGPLGIDASDPTLVQFVPEGGSLSGVLRSLQPAVDLGPPGHLPLHRHGSTASALVQAGEAIAALDGARAIVLVDDFGEDLDSVSARHVASTLRKGASQAWISTRRSTVTEAFPLEEIIRLHRRRGTRVAAQVERLTSKADRVAARHLSLQLLPAASAAVVAIVEGPHDRAALEALAARRFEQSAIALPAAKGIAIVDAGAADGSGGASAVARLATLAKRLGFHTIAVIDGDPGHDGKIALEAAEEAADRVIRLPEGFAVERALIEDLSDDVIISTLQTVCNALDVTPPSGLDTLTGRELSKAVVSALKKNGGLHAQFVELLPKNITPPTLIKILRAITASGETRDAGTDQL
jgi:putative ATP-dependent endonuclease of OLD family